MPTPSVLTFRGFSAADRVAIRQAAKAASRDWGAFHFRADRHAETVSIGTLAGGSLDWDARDAFGIQAIGRGRVELADLRDHTRSAVYERLGDALRVLSIIMARPAHLRDRPWPARPRKRAA